MGTQVISLWVVVIQVHYHVDFWAGHYNEFEHLATIFLTNVEEVSFNEEVGG